MVTVVAAVVSVGVMASVIGAMSKERATSAFRRWDGSVVAQSTDPTHWFTVGEPQRPGTETPGPSVDTVLAYRTYALPARVNKLVLAAASITGTGNNRSDLLVTRAKRTTLAGGDGDDVFVDESAGGSIFAFRPHSGHDVIYGFRTAGRDRDFVQLVGYGLTRFGQVRARLSQAGADAVLTLSTSDKILFRATRAADLSADNFLLPLDRSSLTPTFSEDFNRLSLYDPLTGRGIWKTNFRHGPQSGPGSWDSRTLRGNGEREIYVDPTYPGEALAGRALGLNPFSVSTGALSIRASRTPPELLNQLHDLPFISGLLTTEKSFVQTYGYFEVRAKLPRAKGLWPAFWLLPQDGTWPPEIDVIEQIGGDEVYHNLFTTAPEGRPDGFTTYVPTNSESFHTYGVLWTKTSITWFVDGLAVGRSATEPDLTRPMYMLLNLAVGGKWPGDPVGGFKAATLEVDYIRAYRLPDTAGSP